MAVKIVIIGGSHAGLSTAKNLLAALPKAHITLISTSKDYYYNLSAPRILARPKDYSSDLIIVPIQKLFAKHPTAQFTFLHASVTSFDPVTKTVTTDKDHVLTYTHLIIASGSHTPTPTPVKQPQTDSLRASLAAAQAAIATARTIVIGGAGTVGVELAGEIADSYPAAAVTLIAGARVLPAAKPSLSQEAERQLTALGVEVVTGVRVEDATENAEGKGWKLTLSDGSVREVDLYISAVGVVPNNSFVPPRLLSVSGWVNVDAYLAVPGAAGVYALGDIAEGQPKNIVSLKDAIRTVVQNVTSEVEGRGKRRTVRKPGVDAIVLAIGSKGAVGQINGWGLPQWVASYFKGDFFLGHTEDFVSAK